LTTPSRTISIIQEGGGKSDRKDTCGRGELGTVETEERGGERGTHTEWEIKKQGQVGNLRRMRRMARL